MAAEDTITTDTTTARFEVGRSYSARSACNHECIWTFEVIARTKKFLTIVQASDPKPRRIGVRSWNGIESASPLGTYSMAPVISADRGDA